MNTLGRCPVSPAGRKGHRVGRTKFLVRVILPITVGAIALVGCGGSSSGGGGGGGKSSYTIGFQGPLSGGVADLGINERNAVQLAIEQANAAKTLPYTIKFVQADDQGGAAGSPPAARKFTGDDSVIAVVGPSFSGASNAAGNIYKGAGLLMATPSATLPDIVNHGFTTFYRGIADDNSQGPPDAQYLVKVAGKKKIYMIDDTTDYGKGLIDSFKAELPKAGGTSAGSESAPQTSGCVSGATGSTSQYPSVASKVKSSGADAVFYAGYDCDFALLTKALRNVGYQGQLMSGDGSKSATYIKNSKPASEGALLSCQCSDIASNPKGTDFVKAYKAKWGVDPGTYSAEAYDVTNAIISVLKGLGDNPTRAKVVEGYAAVDYQGLTKEIKFGSDHNLTTQTAYLYQVKNGAFKYLGDLPTLTS
jgi:branched-chain amino acid transport system substrate-binding protein